MTTIEICLAIGNGVLALIVAAVWRNNDILHKRIDKRDEEIKSLDERLDRIDNRLVVIETLLRERQ